MVTQKKTMKKSRLEVSPVVTKKMEQLCLQIAQLPNERTFENFSKLSLLQERNLLRTLIDNLPHSIFIKDTSGRYLMFNKTALQRRGLEIEDQLIGKTDYDFTTKDMADQYRNEELRVINTGKASLAKIESGEDLEGNHIYGCVTRAPIKESDGKVVGICTVAIDVTEQIEAREDLEKGKTVLEKKVKERTNALESANESLKEEIEIRHQTESKLLVYRDQLRFLASELSLTEERTRRNIANDVHDHIGQNLAMAKIKLQNLTESANDEATKQLAKEISVIVSETIDSTRSLTFEISPPVLYELGFEAAIEWLLKKVRKEHGLKTDFVSDRRKKQLNENTKVFLFQAVRELLNNVTKHARAKTVQISVQKVDKWVRISILDDGNGFSWKKIKSINESYSTFGLFSIKERLSYINGKMEVESEISKGTKIVLTAPLAKNKNLME